MTVRYDKEARIVFKGDPSLAKLYIGEGRKHLGFLLSDLEISGRDTGIHRVKNAVGVQFMCEKILDQLPTIFIDVSAVKTKKPYGNLLSGFVMRPSDTSGYDTYGEYSHTILVEPKRDIPKTWFYDQDAKDLISMDALGEGFYEAMFPDGINATANCDWRNGDESLIVYWFGPKNRHWGQGINEWAGGRAYMKGRKVFDSGDLSGSDLATANPDLVNAQSFCTGFAVRNEELLVVVTYQNSNVAAHTVKDYFLAFPLTAHFEGARGEGSTFKTAHYYTVDIAEGRLVGLVEHDSDGGDYKVRNNYHPWMFNASGTEARTLRMIQWDMAQSGDVTVDIDYEMREPVVTVDDNAVSVSYTNHGEQRVLVHNAINSVFEGFPDYARRRAEYSGNATWQGSKMSDYTQSVRRGDDIGYFITRQEQSVEFGPQDDLWIPVAVDYRDGAAVRAYARQETHEATYSYNASVTVTDLGLAWGYSKSSTGVRSMTGVFAGIRTPDYEFTCAQEQVSTTTETVTNDPSGTTGFTMTSDIAFPATLFLDLRFGWHAYVTRRTQDAKTYSAATPTADSRTRTWTFVVMKGETQLASTEVTKITGTSSIGLYQAISSFQTELVHTDALYTVPGTWVDGNFDDPYFDGEDNNIPVHDHTPGVLTQTIIPNHPPVTSQPLLDTVLPQFEDDSDPDFGWMQPQGTPMTAAWHAYFEYPSLPSVGSWVSYKGKWCFSMPFPETVGVARFLTASNFNSIPERFGEPADAERYYPIWVLPDTSIKA